MNEKEVVRHINAYIARHDKRQYEFAAEIGAPVQTVNRWLTGKTKVSKAYQALLKAKGIVPLLLLVLISSGCSDSQNVFSQKERYKLIVANDQVYRIDSWEGGTNVLAWGSDETGKVASWHPVIENDPKIVAAIKDRLLKKYGQGKNP